MLIKEIIECLEQFAPLSLQESYDNCGLIVGSDRTEITQALVTLDCTEEVVDEAIQNGCNFIIAHHPIVFGGIKKLNGKNYVERTVIKAIQNNIAIYAIHTNLDNVFQGVNSKIAEKLGLQKVQILQPKSGLLMGLSTYVPELNLETVREALFRAGAGNLGNYSECSFVSFGNGTFLPEDGANPVIGELHKRHSDNEMKLEVVFPSYLLHPVMAALKIAHPYEEVAYNLVQLANSYQEVGAGMVGELPEPMEEQEFLAYLKTKMELKSIRYTSFKDKKISKVALCGGAGSFLLKQAIGAGAQAYVSADFKYHEFFDAEKQLMIADIGHYESEKFTKSLICEVILKKFPTFAILLSKTDTNPVNYYF
jgi:dinuclear metal center YbgI/SA1388 family protein